MQESKETNTETEVVETQLVEQAITITTGTSKAFSITEKGIVIRDDLTFEEWRDGLKVFKWAQLNLRISLSDYIKFGETKFGAEQTHHAITQLEFPLADITKAVEISTVPAKIRNYNLSAEHLVVLARGCEKAKEMEGWAQKAFTLNLTPAQLKESIKQGEVVSASVASKNQHGIITIHGIRMEAEIWLRRMGGLSGLHGLGQDQKNEILSELELFVQMKEALTQ